MQQIVCMSLFKQRLVCRTANSRPMRLITPQLVIRNVKTPRTMAWYAASNYRCTGRRQAWIEQRRCCHQSGGGTAPRHRRHQQASTAQCVDRTPQTTRFWLLSIDPRTCRYCCPPVLVLQLRFNSSLYLRVLSYLTDYWLEACIKQQMWNHGFTYCYSVSVERNTPPLF